MATVINFDFVKTQKTDFTLDRRVFPQTGRLRVLEADVTLCKPDSTKDAHRRMRADQPNPSRLRIIASSRASRRPPCARRAE
eukprot:16445978-Heterocapsa_arctica.AAC.1